MISIRTRILAPTLVLMIIGSLALVLLALRDSHREIENVYDAQLVQAARLMQGVLQQSPAGRDWQALEGELNHALNRSVPGIVAHPYEMNVAFQIWSADGRLLLRSENAPALAEVPAPGLHDLMYEGQDWCGVLLEDQALGIRIWAGERDDLRQDLIQKIVHHALLPTLVGLPLLTLLIWLLLGWGLRPLQRLARQLRNRPHDSLEPLPAQTLPPELEPMRSALDHVLDQLRTLLDRERRFIADAAHELRTPLAVLDIHVRNAQAASDPHERAEALAFLQQGVGRMTRIASQLLTMARLEPAVLPSQPLNLTELMREELAELTPLALRKDVELVLDSEEDCLLLSEPAALTIMAQNLISNALAFSPAGSEVRLHLSRHADNNQMRLQVLDEGPGVSEAALARLCDRFYSAGNPEGAGLGLAIVDMICRRLGLTLRFSNRAQGGLCVEVLIPLTA
ncbi:sensor histidine kinase [Pseudomonas sp. 3A(2025)]